MARESVQQQLEWFLGTEWLELHRSCSQAHSPCRLTAPQLDASDFLNTVGRSTKRVYQLWKICVP